MIDRIQEYKKMFIGESYQESCKFFKKTLKDGELPKWDYIVLTASNKEQAKIYMDEIETRLKNAQLPKDINYAVVPDEGGERIGSGGATLSVIKYIKEDTNYESLKGKKILVIHSGGDSKRVPQYSAIGKLFSPVQREMENGRGSTLFDELIIAFSLLPIRMKDGMLIMAGDTLLSFNPVQVDLQYNSSVALSMKVPAEVGKDHGVFLTDKNGIAKKFLHKQSVESLKNIGAVDKQGNVDIDTGGIFLDSEIIERLYSLISTEGKTDNKKYKKFVNSKVKISFYADFVYPLSNESTIEQFYKETPEGDLSEELIECRTEIWEKIHEYEMKVINLSPADYIHFGTTEELFNLVTKDLPSYSYIGWNNKVATNIENETDYSINHSYINNCEIGSSSYIEYSYIEDCNIGENTLISNTQIRGMDIPSNICLHSLRLKTGKYVTRIYGINDDPKSKKTNNTVFLNNKLEDIMEKYNIKVEDIWDGQDLSIWNAKLFMTCNTLKESIESAIGLYSLMNCSANKDFAMEWKKTQKESLQSSFNLSDPEFIKNKNEKIELEVKTERFLNLIKKREPVEKIIRILIQSSNLEELIEIMLKKIEKQKDDIKYRAYLAISELLKVKKLDEYSGTYFEDLCYKTLQKSISRKSKIISTNQINDYSKVELPVRVNFGGEWSDTPPYCIENGGTVLNAAFTLNDELPIKAEVKKTNTKSIVLESKDLQIRREFTNENINELINCSNPNDMFSLLKASLIISGIISPDIRELTLEDIVDKIGGGLHLTTDTSKVPRGSGLGTSSILSGACLKALYDITNNEISNEELCNRVLEQEQLMSTGGGWQDQVGGIIEGIKLINTKSGVYQKFNIKKLNLDDDIVQELNKRFCLIFTGQRRLAKNLLKDIIGKYINSDHTTIDTIEKIQRITALMTFELEKGNIDGLAKLFNEHMRLNKILNLDSTNVSMDQIFYSINDLIDGGKTCGAGGGGFIQVILKKGADKKDLDNRLNSIFQDSGIKLWKTKLYMGGIK